MGKSRINAIGAFVEPPGGVLAFHHRTYGFSAFKAAGQLPEAGPGPEPPPPTAEREPLDTAELWALDALIFLSMLGEFMHGAMPAPGLRVRQLRMSEKQAQDIQNQMQGLVDRKPKGW